MGKVRILAVDDEEQILEFLELVTEEFPEIVLDTCKDSRKALEMAISVKYDLIITDHRMPHLSGTAWVKALIKENGLSAKAHKVLISGAVAEVPNMGMIFNLILEKPLNEKELKKVLTMINR